MEAVAAQAPDWAGIDVPPFSDIRFHDACPWRNAVALWYLPR
jgi:hypothetical protein